MPFGNIIDRNAAGALIPAETAAKVFTGVTETSAVMKLATRAQDMPTNVTIQPVLSSLPIAYFVNGDTGLKQTTDMAWGSVNFVAEEIAAIVPIPESVLSDSQYPIWEQVRPKMEEALGLAFDNAVLYGVNRPTTWPQAIVTAATAAGHSIALPAFADLYDALLSDGGLISLVEQDGFAVTGHLAPLRTKARLRSVRDGNGNPIFRTGMQGKSGYELDGEPCIFPRNGLMNAANTIDVAGDWQQLLYCFRQDLTWKLLTEAVIQDNAGNIVFNLAQQDMVALRVVMRVAWQLPNPVNRVNPNPATRYPFAILTP